MKKVITKRVRKGPVHTNNDIIGRLIKRQMEDVVEEIFQFLDYDDLKSAMFVCKDWNRIVLNDKLWRRLIQRNVLHIQAWQSMWLNFSGDELLTKHDSTTTPEDGLTPFFRDLAHKIVGSTNVLRENWRNGLFTLSKIRIGNNDAVLMDYQKMVIHKSSGQIEAFFGMRDRRDLATETEMKSPRRARSRDETDISPGFAFHRDTLVTGVNKGQICFWKLQESRDAIPHFVVDVPQLPEQKVIHGGNKRYRFDVVELSFSPCGRFLLSATTVEDSSHLFDEQHLADLWSVESSASHLHRLSIRPHHGLRLIGLDDKLAVLSTKPLRWAVPGSGRCQIEVRAVPKDESFKLIYRVDGPVSLVSHYKNGILVTAGEDGGMNIKLRTINREGNIEGTRIINGFGSFHSIRLIGEKYLVSWHQNKELKVWNLSTVMDSKEDPSIHQITLLQSYKNPIGVEEGCHCDGFEADEFGVAITIDSSLFEMAHHRPAGRRRDVYVMDFLTKQKVES